MTRYSNELLNNTLYRDNTIDRELARRKPRNSDFTLSNFTYTEFFNAGVQLTKTGKFFVLAVPSRAGRPKPIVPFRNVTQAFNTTVFHKNPTEVLWEGNVQGRYVTFLEQIFPFLYNHFLLLPEKNWNRPQILKYKDISLALLLVNQHPKRQLYFGFNSLQSGATQNHLHLQGFFLQQEVLPAEKENTTVLARNHDINISELVNYPAKGWCFSAYNNTDVLAKMAHQCVEYLQKENIAHVVIFSPTNKIFIFPVKPNHITAFGNTWTFSELMGYIVISNVINVAQQFYYIPNTSCVSIKNYTNTSSVRVLNILNHLLERKIEDEMRNVSIENWDEVKKSCACIVRNQISYEETDVMKKDGCETSDRNSKCENVDKVTHHELDEHPKFPKI